MYFSVSTGAQEIGYFLINLTLWHNLNRIFFCLFLEPCLQSLEADSNYIWLQTSGFGMMASWVHSIKLLKKNYHVLLSNAASISWGSRKELIIRWQPSRFAAPATAASLPHTLKEVCCDLHPAHCGIVITPRKPWYCCNWLAVSQWLHPNTALHGFCQNAKTN